jgi:hypothetical protein
MVLCISVLILRSSLGAHPIDLGYPSGINPFGYQPFRVSTLSGINPFGYQPFRVSTLSGINPFGYQSVGLPEFRVQGLGFRLTNSRE